jgi:hypothetical protein
MAGGLFAASIGLFLWKPWARKLTLIVCVYGLASLVVDMPYITRYALPSAHEDITKSFIREGVDPDDADAQVAIILAVGFGGTLILGLIWLIAQVIYFTRPGVVAAFEAARHMPRVQAVT